MLTLAVGPASLVVDRSTFRVGPMVSGPTCQPQVEADMWGPQVRSNNKTKEHEKG